MKHQFKPSGDVSHYKFISLHGTDRNCLNDVDWDYKRERNKFHEIADTLSFRGATCLLAVVILLLSY